MKKRTILLVVLSLPIIFGAGTITSRPIEHSYEAVEMLEAESEEILESVVEAREVKFDSILEAMILVESNGDSMAVGDTHLRQPSIGVLQIRPIMVKEINRISKKEGLGKEFSLTDRYSKIKSIEMFNIWREYHHPDNNYEAIARTWNGGPNGLRNARTLHYWNKVSRELENLNLDI